MEKIVKSKIKNYYSPGDEVLKQSHIEGSVKNPLGFTGAKGKTISKYSQIKVFSKKPSFC